MRDISIYFHIPFCLSRCHYCHFDTHLYDDSYIADYFKTLSEHLVWFANQTKTAYQIKSVFFGGGTPALIDPEEYQEVFNMLSNIGLDQSAEITIEANPETISFDCLKKFQAFGVNRLSLGVQSFVDEELKWLGRIHSTRKAFEAVLCAKESGIPIISLDLIYGMEYQNLDSWLYTLEKATKLPINHISCYELTLDKGTKLGEEFKKGNIKKPDDEVIANYYKSMQENLNKSGFKQYEISSFAKEGCQCTHNKTYWKNNEYWGIGSSAFSFWDQRRFSFTSDLDKYIKERPFLTKKYECFEEITARMNQTEDLILGLRLLKGVNMRKLTHKYSMDLLECQWVEIKKLIQEEILEKDCDIIRLTQKGVLFADKVAVDLVPE